MPDLGNSAQTRAIADQVAEATVELYARRNPQPDQRPAEIPAPLKWAAGIIVAIMTALAVAMAIWMVTTLSDLQQTITRIDERQQLTGSNTGQRLDKIEERLGRLEERRDEVAK